MKGEMDKCKIPIEYEQRRKCLCNMILKMSSYFINTKFNYCFLALF